MLDSNEKFYTIFFQDTFRHLLVVLGGVKGLEWAVENDDQLKGEVSDPSKLFDIYLNTCPNQVYYVHTMAQPHQDFW